MSNGSEDHHLAYTCFIWKGGYVQWFQQAVRNGTPNLSSSFLVKNSHYNIHNKSFLVKFPRHISKLLGAVFSVKFSIKHEFAETWLLVWNPISNMVVFSYISMWNFRVIILSLIISQQVAHQVRWNRLCRSPMGRCSMILHTHRIHGNDIFTY